MANTKLSNVYGLDKMVKNVPSSIEKYTEEAYEEIKDIRTKSLYYSEMNAVGMVTCMVLLVIGAGATFAPDLILGYLNISSSMIDSSNIFLRIGGMLLLFMSIHEISRMLFAEKVVFTAKNVNKMEYAFKKEFENSAASKIEGDQLINKIESFVDDESGDVSLLDNKLIKSITSVKLFDGLLAKLVLVSRIVIPIVLFISALLVILKGDALGLYRVTLAFIIMFIFNSRLSLLMEYKVSAVIRAVMCVPSVTYGIVTFFSIKTEMCDLNFLPHNILMKIPSYALDYVGSGFVVCLLQMVVLVFSIAFKDYYSEKMSLREGILVNHYGQSKHTKWSIIYRIVLFGVLIGIYSVALFMQMDEIEHVKTVIDVIIYGTLFGVMWRIISPIWPEAISKTIRKFWGIKYSITVELFVGVIIFSTFVLSGFAFSVYTFALLIVIILLSWIAFAIMVHFWGNNKKRKEYIKY